jgi:hypothetical protein
MFSFTREMMSTALVFFQIDHCREVNDRPIPDVEDFLAFVCTLAQGL